MKWLVIALATLAFLYAGCAAGLYIFQRGLLFLADKTVAQPADVGLDDTEVHSLETAEGVTLAAWWARASGNRVAIYFHGNGGSLAWRGDTIEALRDAGFSVLAVEYRGFGASEGSPSEDGLRADADAAYAFARSRGYDASRIWLFGESLGSGVAVSLATRHDVAGLILDSAYSSIADVAADRYWMFPVRMLIRDPFSSDKVIGQIKIPILMLHGTSDVVVPIQFGRKLFAAAGQNATFFEIKDAGHLALNEQAAQQRVKQWLREEFK